jgi:putative colanic acid biosynthesis glycosyltransferase
MKFSIVTICWQNLAGLRATRASLAIQRFRDFEWIVVDGASTDGTIDFLQTLPADEAVWLSEPDAGIYDAMNKGLSLVRGEYVLFLNSGDVLSDAAVLEAVAARIAAAAVPPAFVYGDSFDVYGNGSPRYRRAHSHRTIWRGMFTSHQSMFFRSEQVGSLLHDLGMRSSADYDFVARFLRDNSAPVLYVPLAVSCFDMAGISQRERAKALREDWRVRRNALGLSTPVVAVLHMAHAVHHWLKRRTPALTRALRYSSAR